MTKQQRIERLEGRIRTAKDLLGILPKDQTEEMTALNAKLEQEIKECELLLVIARTL